tara:strand:- start:429 stop:893 length:465 start_codon:yes stop_codon:yes gene_type:complete
MKNKGLWFFGLAGSGKTFCSKLSYNLVKKKMIPILLDGDNFRKQISFDLKYTKHDREIQLKRLYGASKILIENKVFPIVTSVFMNKETLKKCKMSKILVIKIQRDYNKIIKSRDIYKKEKNVVGKDIFYQNLKTEVINNTDKKYLYKNLKKLVN